MGGRKFAELAHINDPAMGFVENDTLTITATIRVERLASVSVATTQ